MLGTRIWASGAAGCVGRQASRHAGLGALARGPSGRAPGAAWAPAGLGAVFASGSGYLRGSTAWSVGLGDGGRSSVLCAQERAGAPRRWPAPSPATCRTAPTCRGCCRTAPGRWAALGRATGASLVAVSEESACDRADPVWPLDREDPLQKGMATHSSILAWRIPWTEESCVLQSMGSRESDTTEWELQDGGETHVQGDAPDGDRLPVEMRPPGPRRRAARSGRLLWFPGARGSGSATWWMAPRAHRLLCRLNGSQVSELTSAWRCWRPGRQGWLPPTPVAPLRTLPCLGAPQLPKATPGMAAFEGCREPEKTRGFLCSLERMELVPGGFLGPLPPKGDPGSRGPMGMRGPAGHQLCAPRKPWSGRSCGYPWKEETSRAPRPSWPLWPPDLLDHPAPGSPCLWTRFCPALTETSSHWPPGPAGSPAPPGPRGPPGLPGPMAFLGAPRSHWSQRSLRPSWREEPKRTARGARPPRLHGGSGESLAAKETLVRRTHWNQRGRGQASPPPGAPEPPEGQKGRQTASYRILAPGSGAETDWGCWWPHGEGQARLPFPAWTWPTASGACPSIFINILRVPSAT